MRIGIDIRSLQDPYRSGVGVYTEELLKKLFLLSSRAKSRDLSWTLFSNAFKEPNLPNFDAPNVPVVRRRFPNRPLNLWMQAFGRPTLDGLLISRAVGRGFIPRRAIHDAAGNKFPPYTSYKLDCFFMPNLKFGTVSKNVPLVVTVHDLAFAFAPEFYPRRGQWSHRLLRPQRLLARADRIIAVSHATKSDLINLYQISAEKITVIYPGPGKVAIPSVSEESPAKRDGIPLAGEILRSAQDNRKKDILFLATVEPRKNVPGLIRAFGLIADKYPETRLVIAGFPGWGEDEVNRECGMRNAECRKRIVRIPNINDQTRSELFARAAVFAYPSFYEGFGFPVLEAMAAGVPVVAGNLGALPEVVGTAGLLADPDDPRSIATALDAVLGDESFASRLRVRGLERAKQFSWDRCAEETLNVLLNAM